MSERTPGNGDEAMDLGILARDDALLDALGRGEETRADDDLAVMLAAWRADLADGAPEPAAVRHAAPAEADAPASVRPATRRRSPASRTWLLRLAAAVVAVITLTAGLGIGSRNAGPSSPLWSLTKLLYPQQAEVRQVEETIARARAALTAGRLDEAQRLVDQARADLGGITDPATGARLRLDLDALARDIAAARATATPTASPDVRPTAPTPRPGTGSAGPAPQPSPERTTAEPSSPPAAESSPLLPLPQLPLPSAPDPSLLSPLPGLPLPTGGLLD